MSIATWAGIPKVIHFIIDDAGTTSTYGNGKWSPAAAGNVESWRTLNPDYSINIWNETLSETFVNTQYGSIYPYYKKLLAEEQRDLLRYLIVRTFGGVYVDQDVQCVQPISKWHPDMHSPTVDFLCGVEADVYDPGTKHTHQLARYQQFLQWTFAGSPANPICDCLVHKFEVLARQVLGDSLSNKQTLWDRTDTMELTGPGLFTDCVKAYLYDNSAQFKDVAAFGGRVGKMIVLPINAFTSSALQTKTYLKAEKTVPTQQEVVANGLFAVHHVAPSWRATPLIYRGGSPNIAAIDDNSSGFQKMHPRNDSVLTLASWVHGFIAAGILSLCCFTYVRLRQQQHASSKKAGSGPLGGRLWASCKAALFDRKLVMLVGFLLSLLWLCLSLTFAPRNGLFNDSSIVDGFKGDIVRFKAPIVAKANDTIRISILVNNTGNQIWSRSHRDLRTFLMLDTSLPNVCPFDRRFVYVEQPTVLPTETYSFAFKVRFKQTVPVLTSCAHAWILGVRVINSKYSIWPQKRYLVSERSDIMVISVALPSNQERTETPNITPSLWVKNCDAKFIDVGDLPPFIDLRKPLPTMRIVVKNTGSEAWEPHSHVLTQTITHHSGKTVVTSDSITTTVRTNDIFQFAATVAVNGELCDGGILRISWSMAKLDIVKPTIPTRFGLPTKETSLPCSALPCLQFRSNVVRGTTFMNSFKSYLSQYGNEGGIPKIIHQSWKSDTCSSTQSKWIKSFEWHNPTWLHVWWSDAEVDRLVREFSPEQSWKDNYDAFAMDILRLDFSRYLMLYVFGGIYADVDVEAVQSFDRLVDRQRSAFLSTEPDSHAGFLNLQTETLCNAVMGSNAGHQFWRGFIDYIFKVTNYRDLDCQPVDVTGPRALQAFVTRWRLRHPDGSPLAIKAFADQYFMPHIASYQIHKFMDLCRQVMRSVGSGPISKSPLRPGANDKDKLISFQQKACQDLQAESYLGKPITNNTFTIHHWTCTWC